MKKSRLDLPIYLFQEGTNTELYKLMKISYVLKDGKKVWRFRCWAPRAKSVSVVGDFNNWDRTKNTMQPIGGGVWEGYARALRKYDIYKFSIEGVNGAIINKADPFALHTETPPSNASKIYDISGYKWQDKEYYKKIKDKNIYQTPMNIYELHVGSWKRHIDGNPLNYRDLAKTLIPYVKDMGYTHIELLPITAHPLDASWGYQVGNLYAPTSRFGTPHDLMYFIDKCHQSDIGVLLDFVISHFPKDEFGLYEFDGAPLYEYTEPTKQEHKTWGTRIYDYGRPEVQSFLISAAKFWFEHYHIDGMRLDAVASMLYLDYDRKSGEWKPNKLGGNYNLEAIEFLKTLNKTILTDYPSAIMIAEESTAFPMVTMPSDIGGLGFNFKWNMGWMNDVLAYIKIDNLFRKGSHDKLTFSLTYAFSENYILPFSHDEVVHGKASMISKMPGAYHDKFCALKALYTYQMTHPGKKLNFMGNEFGQFIEWDFSKQLDWMLLEYDSHSQLKEYVKALNHLYIECPPLYELDSTYDGFKWLVVDDASQNVVAYYRQDKAGNRVIVVINFSGVTIKDYEIGVPDAGSYEIVLNSNSKEYGGSSTLANTLKTFDKSNHNHNQSISLTLEGNAALIIKLI